MPQSMAITAAGMMTGVGLGIDSCVAAIRCELDNFQESRFRDRDGEPLLGCEVPLETPWRGRRKLLELAKGSIAECLKRSRLADVSALPLLLCLPEQHRPGRQISDDHQFFLSIEDALKIRFATSSRVLNHGHTSVAVALKYANSIMANDEFQHCLICGVDSYFSAKTLEQFDRQDRLLTERNSNGFIPGEGSATVLVSRKASVQAGRLDVLGLGFGIEKAVPGSELPLKADGLATALKAALQEADLEMQQIDYRLTDMTGELYYFKEASLALCRTLHVRVEDMDILHLADCIGETGSAAGVAMMAYQQHMAEKGFAGNGNVMCHMSDADGKRAAVIVRAAGGVGNG